MTRVRGSHGTGRPRPAPAGTADAVSSDALSSVAYATEEILHVLLLAGVGALALSLPIGAAIVLLLLFVGISYRQTIKAYPPAAAATSSPRTTWERRRR